MKKNLFITVEENKMEREEVAIHMVLKDKILSMAIFITL
jgi:hypothetical protein